MKEGKSKAMNSFVLMQTSLLYCCQNHRCHLYSITIDEFQKFHLTYFHCYNKSHLRTPKLKIFWHAFATKKKNASFYFCNLSILTVMYVILSQAIWYLFGSRYDARSYVNIWKISYNRN